MLKMQNKRQRVITENVQDTKEDLLFGLKLKLDILSELNDVFENDPDGVTQQQIQEMKQDIRQSLRSLRQQGTSLSDMYNRFGAMFFKSKILQSNDLIGKLSNNKEKSIIDLVNEDLLLEARLDRINDQRLNEARQRLVAKQQGIFIQNQQVNQLAQNLQRRFGNGGNPPGNPPPPGNNPGNNNPRQPPQNFFGNNQPPNNPPQPPNNPPQPPQNQFSQNIMNPQLRLPQFSNFKVPTIQEIRQQQPSTQSVRQQLQDMRSLQYRQQRQQNKRTVSSQQRSDNLLNNSEIQRSINDSSGFFIIPQSQPIQAQQIMQMDYRKDRQKRKRKILSQMRQTSPQQDFTNTMNRPLQLTNVKNQLMEDISNRPDRTEARNSEELKEMLTTLEKKIYDFSDIKLRNKSPKIIQQKQDTAEKIKQRDAEFNSLTIQIYNDQNVDGQMLQRYSQLAIDINSSEAVNTFVYSIEKLFEHFINKIPVTQKIQQLIRERGQKILQIQDQANLHQITKQQIIEQLMQVNDYYSIEIDQELQQQQQIPVQSQEEQKQRSGSTSQMRQQKKDAQPQILEQLMALIQSGDLQNALKQMKQFNKDKQLLSDTYRQVMKALLDNAPQSRRIKDLQQQFDQNNKLNSQELKLFKDQIEMVKFNRVWQYIQQGDLYNALNDGIQIFDNGEISTDQMRDILNQILELLPQTEELIKAVEHYNEIGDLHWLHEYLSEFIQQNSQEQPQIQEDIQMQDLTQNQKKQTRGRSKNRPEQRQNQEEEKKEEIKQQRSISSSRSQTLDMNKQAVIQIQDQITNGQHIQAINQMITNINNFELKEKTRRLKQQYTGGSYFNTKTKQFDKLAQNLLMNLPLDNPQLLNSYYNILQNQKASGDRNMALVQFFNKIIQDLSQGQ